MIENEQTEQRTIEQRTKRMGINVSKARAGLVYALFMLAMFLGMTICVVVSLGNVSAEVLVHYNIRQAIIENDGSSTLTNTAVSGVDSIGYVCLNSDCTNIGNQVNGLTKHTSTSVMDLTSPTVLLSQFGYVTYFYKDGYIGWEQQSNWAGNGETTSSKIIYLSKKRTGFAPIMNMNVLNKVIQYKPIEINVTAGIDADTYSAIQDARDTGIPLNEEVETRITLEIRNSAGNIIHTEVQDVSIHYSGSEKVSFDYVFENEGNYTINLYTDVTDAKIINSVRQTASAKIYVIPQNLTNYSYSLLEGLEFIPSLPRINEQMNFSGRVLSNYADGVGDLHILNSIVNASFYRNGVFLSSQIINVDGNNPTVFNNFNFSKIFTQEGDYELVAVASPLNAQGNRTLTDTKTVTFHINPALNETNQTDTTAPVITINSPTNRTYNNSNILINVTSNEDAVCSYSLNLGAYNVLNSTDNKNFIRSLNLSDGAYLLKIMCVDLAGNAGEANVNFVVNQTSGGDDDDDDDDDSDDDEDDKKKKSCDNDFESLDLNDYVNQTTINLTKPAPKEAFNIKAFLYWLIILILLVLIAIVGVYIVRYA